MRDYDRFIKGLREDIEVPVGVRVKFRNALADLPEVPDKKWSRRKKYRWLNVAAAAVAVLMLGIGFCYSNPVLASKIPIIGRIFEQIENDITFSGDYQDKKEVLTEAQSNTATEEEKLYTVNNAGVAVTASEIYCDGYSIFLTAEVKSETGLMSRIPEFYVRRYGEETAHSIYASGNWSSAESGEGGELLNAFIEGKVIDDNTFIGMFKIDLKEPVTGSGVFDLNLTELGYDDLEATGEDIRAAHRFEGNWDFSIPFNVDTESVREIEVNQKDENGLGVDRVVLSPYQVVVYIDAPDNTGIAVFDQDGQALDTGSGEYDYRRAAFAVQGNEIKALNIFLVDDVEYEIDMYKAQDVATARSLAAFESVVEIEE